MKIIYLISLISSIALFSCGVQSTGQKIEKKKKSLSLSNNDLEKSILNFNKSVLKENLVVNVHDRVPTYYWDIQMIFEADDFKSDHFNSYTTYADMQYFDKPIDENYNGVILFAATYKDVASALHAFQELKSRTQIRMKEIEGQAGLLVEQVRIFERIRTSGGLLTQKDQYVFYLLESCGAPPIGVSWNEYENLFLSAITEKNEEIEIINADCKKDEFWVQKLKANR